MARIPVEAATRNRNRAVTSASTPPLFTKMKAETSAAAPIPVVMNKVIAWTRNSTGEDTPTKLGTIDGCFRQQFGNRGGDLSANSFWSGGNIDGIAPQRGQSAVAGADAEL